MATPARKPLANTTNSVGRRAIAENTPIRPSNASPVPATSGQGLARTPSIRQTRPARKFASRTSNSFSADASGDDDEETRASNAQLIAELKEQVLKAEHASDQYQKQLEILQARFDEISGETTIAEDRAQQHESKIQELEHLLKDSVRQKREIEQEHESEKAILLQERDRRVSKEEELQSVIQRLNETIRQKDKDRLSMSRSASIQNSLAALEGSSSPTHGVKETAEALLHKDEIIDTLRLELVEAQLKLTEMDHQGDGRLQELEKALMETKMANARLTEDNESFQYLLSEKTLKGDFLHDTPITENPAGLSSLAEELESAGDGMEGQNEGFKKLESENKHLREANKALTVYIDKIIGRILQHEGFEDIITGVSKDEAPRPPSKNVQLEKALPAPPEAAAASPAPTLLQRARSVVQRPAVTKARPQSIMATPTANENPDTAPSIPLNRGHRRARSEQERTDMAAAAVVAQMNRGSPLRTVSGGPMSPGISPQLQPVRASYFQQMPPPSGRAPSGGLPSAGRGSSANSVTSEHSGDKDKDSATDVSSAPPSSQGANSIPGAVMKQNQLRPLRLVRDQLSNEEDTQKKANRGSWMGWLKGGNPEAQSGF